MSTPDLIAVLSKTAIVLLTLPLLVFLICVMTYAFVLTLSTVVLLGTPHVMTMFFAELQFVPSFLCLAVVLIAIYRREKSS